MVSDRDESEYSDPQETYQREPMDAYAVRLTAWHARMARRLGQGNLSRGIRITIEKLSKIVDVKS